MWQIFFPDVIDKAHDAVFVEMGDRSSRVVACDVSRLTNDSSGTIRCYCVGPRSSAPIARPRPQLSPAHAKALRGPSASPVCGDSGLDILPSLYDVLLNGR